MRAGAVVKSAAAVVLAAALVIPAAAGAALPKPRKAAIVPGKSIAGLKLDMSKAQTLSKWGSTKCDSSVCTWEGPGKAGHNERAIVSFYKGKVIQISISGAFTGNNLKFKPGPLAHWKTSKGISLGSKRAAVGKAYPKAKPNSGEAVQGFDLFAGARPNLRYTRFSTSGIGASGNRLRSISLAWDTCHYSPCS
jgi:hypothetical protein